MWQIGFVAGICTSGCMVPQVIKIIKTKSAEDISWLMLAMSFVGNILWIIHGNIISDVILIVFASISFILSIFLIGAKTYTNKFMLPISINPKPYVELKENPINNINV